MSDLRILVVEDNALNRRLICDVLAYNGHHVVAAEDVASARTQLSGQRFDLVVADLQMPGGGGEALLSEIRATPAIADTPVAVVTASAMQGDRERLLARGFDAYFSKPIDTRTIASKLEAVAATTPRRDK